MSRHDAERWGRQAERRAAWWLRLHGWRIVGQRVRNPAGEIDLIARRGRMVAFVEVKARQSAQALDNAIDHHRLRRVAAAARLAGQSYIAKGCDMRIDVILIAPGCWPRHLVNVWQDG